MTNLSITGFAFPPVGSSGLQLSNGSLVPILSFSTMALLQAFPVTNLLDGTQADLAGYYAASDGGEGTFDWNSTSTGSHNAGTIILPTGQSSGTPGRWIRRKHANRDIYPVRWYGAKGDASTNDTTAIGFAIVDAQTTKPVSTAINTVLFSGGNFMTDGHTYGYTDVKLAGMGALITRVTHRDNNAKPLFYISGGASTVAAPYGGVTGMFLKAGSTTYPAILYVDTCLDNQWNWNDIAFGGSTSSTNPCDGISIFDFLNAGATTVRADTINGYAIRIRGSSCKATLAVNSGGTYKSTSLNTGTGVWTFTTNNTRINPGSAMMAFTTGTLPTNHATGAALVSGPAGGVFFAGNCSETTMTLHTNPTDAKAGTNAITYDDSGSGTHGFAKFSTYFAMSSIDTATDTITFVNDKNCIIPTTVAESSKSVTYGSGYTGSGTIVSGGAGSLGGIHVVFVYSDGTYPAITGGGNLAGGTPYYPIYVSPTQIKLATTVANATAGTAIDLADSGSGNITLLYDHQSSQLGIGGFCVRDFTYDNASAGTTETINSVACGGYGAFYANYEDFDYKGSIEFWGHRVEINKMLARDIAWGNSQRCLFRIERSNNNPENQGIQFVIRGMEIDFSASIATSQAAHVRIVGNRGTPDLAPGFEKSRYFGGCTPYENDTGTAASRVLGQIGSKRCVLDNVAGAQVGFSNVGRTDGAAYGAIFGKQITPFNISQVNNSFVKPQDMLISNDNGVAWYCATQTQAGWSAKADGTLSIGATVTGTAGSAVFTLSTTPTQQNFCLGAAVSIAGAGAASAALVGIVRDMDLISATKTFTLGDSAGALNPCVTNVSGAATTYVAATLGQVGVKYTASAALDFGLIAAQTSADLLISSPSGITFTAGKVVGLGRPSNVSAGVTYEAFVTAGGTSVTVRATNASAAGINPASGTFSIEVAV